MREILYNFIHENPMALHNIPRLHSCNTISPTGVVGFSDYCQRHSDLAGASLIVKMLNAIYTAFDVLTDTDRNPEVYKVRDRTSSFKYI